MNLDDLVLLRGWINQIDWTVLDSQLPETEESSRKRNKDLRRQLSLKARFYGKPEQAELWLAERGSSETWQRHALTALNTLNRLPDPAPDLAHGVNQWFPEPVCAGLPPQVNTLAELIDLLEAVIAGETPCPETLKPALKKLIGFFDEHALQLGYQLNKKPESSVLPVPLRNVAPLERVLIPVELNGEQGSNRALEPCRIHATHDLEAIDSWLALKDDNAKPTRLTRKNWNACCCGRFWSVAKRSHRSIPMIAGPISGF